MRSWWSVPTRRAQSRAGPATLRRDRRRGVGARFVMAANATGPGVMRSFPRPEIARAAPVANLTRRRLAVAGDLMAQRKVPFEAREVGFARGHGRTRRATPLVRAGQESWPWAIFAAAARGRLRFVVRVLLSVEIHLGHRRDRLAERKRVTRCLLTRASGGM